MQQLMEPAKDAAPGSSTTGAGWLVGCSNQRCPHVSCEPDGVLPVSAAECVCLSKHDLRREVNLANVRGLSWNE